MDNENPKIQHIQAVIKFVSVNVRYVMLQILMV